MPLGVTDIFQRATSRCGRWKLRLHLKHDIPTAGPAVIDRVGNERGRSDSGRPAGDLRE
jgi:hypothetical protein